MFKDDYLKKLRLHEADWQQRFDLQLQDTPPLKKNYSTDSGIAIKPLYTALDVTEAEKAEFPGEYPYTRGIHPSMYRSSLWTMRQLLNIGGAEEMNARYHTFLAAGQTALSLAFDLPTQIGYDSDHPLAFGEVGRVGVAIDSLADMEILLEGIPLEQISLAMNINAPAAIIFAMYLVIAKQQGVTWESLRGTIQNDILKEYFARGTYIYPPEQSLRIITDIATFCTSQVPNWNMLSISGYHIREAGATAVQELAFTLANAITYVDAIMKAGLPVDHFAGRLSFYFNANQNFFEEIAKFRAARRLWAKLMKERFGAQNPRSLMMRFHAETAGSTLTANFPDVNTIRVAYQALAAVLGGTQGLHTTPSRNESPQPSPHAELVARCTQEIIAGEIGVTDTIDPLGGSYYIEALTDEIEQATLSLIAKIDELGGAVSAIKQGFMHKEIQQSAYKYQKQVESGERLVIGVNKHAVDSAVPRHQPKVDRLVEEEQVARLREVKKRRDQRQVVTALRLLRSAAQNEQNLMPFIIEAVSVYATVGEICDVLREVFGEYDTSDAAL